MKILKFIAATIIAIAIAAATVVLTAPAWLANAETAGTAAVQPFVKITPGAKLRTVREVRKVRTVRGVRNAGDR